MYACVVNILLRKLCNSSFKFEISLVSISFQYFAERVVFNCNVTIYSWIFGINWKVYSFTTILAFIHAQEANDSRNLLKNIVSAANWALNWNQLDLYSYYESFISIYLVAKMSFNFLINCFWIHSTPPNI